MRGDVELGSLEGVLLHRATLRDISLKDASGKPVLEIAAIRVDPDLVALLFEGVVRLKNARVIEPKLHLATDAEGRLNLSQLFVSTSTSGTKKTGFTPITVELED